VPTVVDDVRSGDYAQIFPGFLLNDEEDAVNNFAGGHYGWRGDYGSSK